MAGHYLLLVLLGPLGAKLLAASLTMWIGGSGGVFAPSLFMGAMLGAAYGTAVHCLLPHLAAAWGRMAWSGWVRCSPPPREPRSPAVIIVFELTGDYNIILPLLFAIVEATALSHHLSLDTIYTLKLRRRGIDI